MNALEGQTLSKLYNTMQSIEVRLQIAIHSSPSKELNIQFPNPLQNKLGGGEGIKGLYGSINQSGMKKVVNCLQHFCNLNSSSQLVDIGAGLGRPLLHALVSPGIASAHGIEIDRIKCDKAEAFLKQTLLVLGRRVELKLDLPIPTMTCAPIEDISTLEPFSHAYSFWEGVPADARAAFGKLFAESSTLHSVAVVQRAIRGINPEIVMEEDYCFGRVALMGSFAVSMSGSGQTFTCYVFRKKIDGTDYSSIGGTYSESLLPTLAVDTPPPSIERTVRTVSRININNNKHEVTTGIVGKKAAAATNRQQHSMTRVGVRIRKPTYKMLTMNANMKKKVVVDINKDSRSTRRGLLTK